MSAYVNAECLDAPHFQWALNAWPNILLTALLLSITLYLGWMRGYSALGMISKKADVLLVSNLRKRFGDPGTARAHY
jgi:hypothetical protein